MAQIMVIEPEEAVVSALKKAFVADEEVKLLYLEKFSSAIEILNGNPQDKEIYEKCKTSYEEAKKELQDATAKEVSAKAVSMNTAEILDKYRNELNALRNQDVVVKKEAAPPAVGSSLATPVVEITQQETQEEIDVRKLSLEKEIERLSIDLKNQKEILLAATKQKTDKEKIASDRQTTVEDAKAKIPAAADQIYSVLMISSNLLLPNVAQWLEDFKKKITFDPNKEIKIIVLGFEFDEKNVKKHLNPRISDYMIKPVDELLARQNIKFLALTEKKSKREVYSLQIKAPVDLVFEYELEGICEVSFSIKSSEKFEINEFKAFSSELFLRKGQQSVLGKCLSSSEKVDGGFSSEFWFVGMDSHLSFQIRSVIKNAPKL